MATSIEICNMALSNLGIGETVANIETEKTESARALKLFYSTARKMTLRDHPWGFADRTAALGLVADYSISTDPQRWSYAFRVPANSVFVRSVENGIRNNTSRTAIPFELSGDDFGELVLSDLNPLFIRYTADVTNGALYPPDFVIAMAYLLAALVSPRLAKGDPSQMREKNMSLYVSTLNKARANSSNEAKADDANDADMIQARY